VTDPQVRPDPAFGLLKLYDDGLPHVYGYLPARCGDTRLAEDLTAESFVGLVRRGVGAQRRGELHVNADGTIGHGDAVLMFAEASDLWLDVPVRAPDSPATFSHTLHLEVDDVHASTERARPGAAAPRWNGSRSTSPAVGARWSSTRSAPLGAEPEVQLCYRVDDIAAAVERVRAAGGHADEPERKPHGLTAECVDDQRASFRPWQPADRPGR
jgi:hypothetical protein